MRNGGRNSPARQAEAVIRELIQNHPVAELAGVYESHLAAANDRKNAGRYYTPPTLVSRLLDEVLEPVLDEAARQPNPGDAILSLRICDPSCGAGRFLVAAAERIAARLASLGHPGDAARCLHGIDIDPIAVELCRSALSRAANLRHTDALLDPPADFRDFDVVIGNPPWCSFTGRQTVGADQDYRRRLVAAHPAIARWPSTHGAFLIAAARMAKPAGCIGFVLPLQMAEQEAYADVRRSLAASGFEAVSIVNAGEDSFRGVTQAAGLFTFRGRGGVAASDWGSLRVKSETHPLREHLPRLMALPRFAPKTFTDPGVHTGNIAKKLILAAPPGSGRFAPIREGRDIVAFRSGPPQKWLRLDASREEGEYCRIREFALYERTPILIRQTANRPIAAIHTDPTYFRNSLLACRGVDGVPHAVTVACLNSALFASLHRFHWGDANQKSFPQVKVNHLQRLPAVRNCDGIERLVRSASDSPLTADRLLEIEKAVLEMFDLPPELAEPLTRSL